jgi:hypothetical protein
MIYAESRAAVDQARGRFVRNWKLRCPPVVDGLAEAGDDLFTFLAFPKGGLESPAHDECPRAHQRRIPTSHENPGESAEPGRRVAVALWLVALGP